MSSVIAARMWRSARKWKWADLQTLETVSERQVAIKSDSKSNKTVILISILHRNPVTGADMLSHWQLTGDDNPYYFDAVGTFYNYSVRCGVVELQLEYRGGRGRRKMISRVLYGYNRNNKLLPIASITRSSADADNGLDAFSGQSRSITMALFFWAIQCRKTSWPWNRDQGSLKVIGNVAMW